MSDHRSNKCDMLDISEQDVLKAMKAMQGYIDITPADFREIYRVAFALAMERMKTSVKAGDLMTSPVHSVRLAMSPREAAEMLAEKKISGAPVLDDDGKIVGVVSEKDFLKKMGAGSTDSFMQVIASCLTGKGCVAAPMRHARIKDLMSAPAITAGSEITMADISALFLDKGINRLPIVDDKNRPIGIVARSDLVRSYCLMTGP